jgi:predicted MFS family arabinose efflux permease
LVQIPGWPWIFWLLAISSGVCLLMITAFLPETSRNMVGTGSRKTAPMLRPLFTCFQPSVSVSSPCHEESTNVEKTQSARALLPERRRWRVPNPLASLRLLWAKDTALITSIFGIHYMNFSCLQASLSSILLNIYRISELKTGLAYLPFGIGSCIGSYLSGIGLSLILILNWTTV